MLASTGRDCIELKQREQTLASGGRKKSTAENKQKGNHGNHALEVFFAAFVADYSATYRPGICTTASPALSSGNGRP